VTPREAVLLTRYVKACCPQQAIDEFTPDAWSDLLGDLRLEDCRQAAAAIARRQPFAAPAEIRAEVRRIRDSRLEGFRYVPVDGDDSPQVYLASLRAQRQAVADGRREADPPAVESGRPRGEAVKALLAGAFRRPS
jgi:hypothetical protein